MPTTTKLMMILVALASLGCGSVEKTCEKTWEHVAPIYDKGNYDEANTYANDFQAAFMAACPKLSDEDRACLAEAQNRKGLKNCSAATKQISDEWKAVAEARRKAK